jgi:sugar-specific transcriptional regulator TrmB
MQRLGFSEYEARTYLTLLQGYPATAYEVSKAANLPRSNTYAALDSLTRKRAVQPVNQQPARFVPVAPETLLSRISEDTTERCRSLTSELGKLQVEPEGDFVWTLEGRQKVRGKIGEMIDNAREHVWIKADESVIEPHIDKLAAAASRGVSLLIILFGDDPERFAFPGDVQVYLHEGNGVRIGNADNMFTITTDFDMALTASVVGEDVATYTSSKPFVTMAESLIRHDVYIAEIFQRFGPELEEAFGPFLVRLRLKYFSQDQLVRLRETMTQLFPEMAETQRIDALLPEPSRGGAGGGS